MRGGWNGHDVLFSLKVCSWFPDAGRSWLANLLGASEENCREGRLVPCQGGVKSHEAGEHDSFGGL